MEVPWIKIRENSLRWATGVYALTWEVEMRKHRKKKQENERREKRKCTKYTFQRRFSEDFYALLIFITHV